MGRVDRMAQKDVARFWARMGVNSLTEAIDLENRLQAFAESGGQEFYELLKSTPPEVLIERLLGAQVD